MIGASFEPVLEVGFLRSNPGVAFETENRFLKKCYLSEYLWLCVCVSDCRPRVGRPMVAALIWQEVAAAARAGPPRESKTWVFSKAFPAVIPVPRSGISDLPTLGIASSVVELP